jgi:hypothetical protein
MNEIPPAYLITFYSDWTYRRAALMLKKQAKRSGLFSDVKVWNPKEVRKRAPQQYDNLQKLLNVHSGRKIGYGFWYWKPVVIEESLKLFPDNSILVYLDAGCYLNLDNDLAINRMRSYLVNTWKHGSFAMQLRDGEFGIQDLSEESWTRSFVLDHFGLTNQNRESNQIQAGVQFLMINSENLVFASKWRSYCEKDDFAYLIGSDSQPSEISKNHRYDQSIFSCLYKAERKYFLPDETYFEPSWTTDGREFPIWALRNRDGIDRFQKKFSDYLPRLVRRIRQVIARSNH